MQRSFKDKTHAYQNFAGVSHAHSIAGWDAKSTEYARLPGENRIFSLSKKLLYDIIGAHVFRNGEREPMEILDFNSGCGNDFPFFLNAGCNITACDGSLGMLKIAAENYSNEIESGRISLFHGMYLRSESKLRYLLRGLPIRKTFGILTITPPYQSGYNPGPKWANFHYRLERRLKNFRLTSPFADQIAILLSSENNIR